MKDQRALSILHFFTVSGRTFTFRDVTDFKANESVITFTYIAASDGRTKIGTFYVPSLAGFSVSAA